MQSIGTEPDTGGQFCTTGFIADYSNDYCRRGLGDQMVTALKNMAHAKKNTELQAALVKQEGVKGGKSKISRGEIKREVLSKEDGLDGAAPTVAAMEEGVKLAQGVDEFGWMIMPSAECAAEVANACALDHGFREKKADPRVEQLVAFWKEKDEDATGVKMVRQMKTYTSKRGDSSASEQEYLKKIMPEAHHNVLAALVKVMKPLNSRQRATILGSLVHVSPSDQKKMLQTMGGMSTTERAHFIMAMSHATIEDQAKMMLKIETVSPEEKRVYLAVMSRADSHDQAKIIDTLTSMHVELATRFLRMVKHAKIKLQPKIMAVMSGVNADEQSTLVSIMTNAPNNEKSTLQDDIIGNMDVMTKAQKSRFMQVRTHPNTFRLSRLPSLAPFVSRAFRLSLVRRVALVILFRTSYILPPPPTGLTFDPLIICITLCSKI
jgi:hypothetical protein